jgi:hypothetical protein
VGLDWSGASRAGRKIWEAHIEVTDRPRLVHLNQPFASSPSCAGVRTGFAQWFAALRADIVGMDFCFGLAEPHVAALFSAAGRPRTSEG